MINLDYKSDLPIYEQIYNGFEYLIKCGVLKSGDKMPSVRELASGLSINPNTVQKAMMLMEAKNLTYTVKGKGSYVADNIEVLKQADYTKLVNEIQEDIKQLKAMGFSEETIRNSINDILKEEGILWYKQIMLAKATET